MQLLARTSLGLGIERMGAGRADAGKGVPSVADSGQGPLAVSYEVVYDILSFAFDKVLHLRILARLRVSVHQGIAIKGDGTP